MNKTLVVIPYCSQGAQGRELEYAVAGWRRHFKEDYLIVLAGENHPVTKTGDDIMCIESPRVPGIPGQYRQHLDYVSCFKKVRAAFPESKGFIFVADDCYAVNDFTLDDVKKLKALPNQMFSVANPLNGWEVDEVKTRMQLLKEGYPIHNYTTHLPQWFEWDKLEALWKRYNMEQVSYVFEDLYYNIYNRYEEPFRLNQDLDDIKFGVYTRRPDLENLRKAFNRKIWITNSPCGWVPELEKLLNDYYGV